MIEYYFKKYVEQPAGGAAVKIRTEGITAEHFAEAAKRTEGFSGREIAKLGIAWQSAAYGTADAKLDPYLFGSVLEAHVAQKALKSRWRVDSENTDSHRQQAVASS